MAESTPALNAHHDSGGVSVIADRGAVRHSVTVRVLHWLVSLCFVALLVSGIELIVSHPRFYWGEEGNVNTPALFSFPIPSSRASVPTGYGYVLPDQNGWSRALHFQTAWILVFSGVWYWVAGAVTSHFRRRLLPSASALAPSSLLGTVKSPLRFRPAGTAGVYNPLQQIAYLAVIFGAFPLIIWTGLAMSPAVTSAFPFLVEVLGGHQSARTLHFVATVLLSGFVLGHVLLVWRAGFRERMRGMITGG